MSVVIVRFEREGKDGIVPPGTYLSDAAKRMGVDVSATCGAVDKAHACLAIITLGEELLSPPSATETEHFERNGRRFNERLLCEAKIIKPGEIVIMTDEPGIKTETAESTGSSFQDEFRQLPLDKKFASLFKLEVMTLGEAVTCFVDSSLKAVEKVGDVISDFGSKIETEAKNAVRPEESATAASETPRDEENRKKGPRGPRRPSEADSRGI